MSGEDGLGRPESPAGSDSVLSDASESQSRRDIMNSISNALDKIKAAGALWKGSETIVDTSVRNTWELDASQFEIRGAAWSRVLESCIAQVGKTLGISSPITAELYKMLIYETGAMFKPHTDTEKIPGMFGTLVICLPSPHEGGDLLLKHRGQTKTYKTSTNQPSILCWYSDVPHEVLPVTSGYRWVLTYNLAIPPDQERPSAALLQSETRELRHALCRWLEYEARRAESGARGTGHLYHLLDYEYTEASVAFKALKATDLARVQCLRDLSTELEFDVFLAVLEKRERGETEWNYYDQDDDDGDDDESWHYIHEALETSLSIRKLVDLDGTLLRSKMKIDDADIETNMIQEYDPFECVDDRNEEYEGYMGNYSPSATHWYRTSVAVLIPRHSTDKFLTKRLGAGTAQRLLPTYAKKSLDPDSKPSVREIMRRLAHAAWATSPDSGITADGDDRSDEDDCWYTSCKRDSNIVNEVLKTALMLRDHELFNNVIAWAGGVGSFALVKAIALRQQLDFGQVKEGLVDSLSKRPLENLAECLQELRPDDTESNDYLEAVTAEVVDQALKKLEQGLGNDYLREDDGCAIITMVSRSKDYDLFKTRVLPIIEASINSTPFALAAIHELMIYASDGVFPQTESLELCKRLAESAISAMDIATLRDRDTAKAVKEQARFAYYGSPPPVTTEERSRTISCVTLSSIFKDCLKYGWDSALMTLSLKIAAQAASIPAAEFPRLWLPFLKDVLKLLPPSPAPRYKQLALAVLESFLASYVGPYPLQSSQPSQQDLSLPEVRCLKYSIQPCRDCPDLNSFLTSRVERVGRFMMGEARRRHLQQMLDQRFRGLAGPALVKYSTDRSTKPETLVVTKLGRGSDGMQLERKAWQERVQKAKGVIKGLDEQGRLAALLGEAEYRAIVEMEVLKRAAPAEAVGGVAVPPGGGVAGTKRRAEDAGMDVLGRGAVSRF